MPKHSKSKTTTSVGAEGPSPTRARHVCLMLGLMGPGETSGLLPSGPNSSLSDSQTLPRKPCFSLEFSIHLPRAGLWFLALLGCLKNATWKRLNLPDPALQEGNSQDDGAGNIWVPLFWAGHPPIGTVPALA